MHVPWRPSLAIVLISSALLVGAGCAPAAPTPPTQAPKPAATAAPAPAATKAPAAAPTAAPAAAAPAKTTAAPAALKINYPTKTITLVVPGSPGGGADILCRRLAEFSKPFLSQPIVVVNKPGAGGQTGLAEGAGQTDGHTFVLASRSNITMNPYIAETKYDYTDFRGILMAQVDPTYVAIPGNSKFKDLTELIKYAQDSGGKLTISGGQVGSVEFLVAKLLGDKAKFTYSFIPFAGGGNIGLDLAGGHSDMGFLNASDTLELIRGGKIRLLGVARDQRVEVFKDVPTLKEKGYDVGDQDQWRGFIVAKQTPDEIVAILHDTIKKVIALPEFLKYQDESGMTSRYLNSADFQKVMAEQSEATKKLFGELGVLKRK